MNIKEHLMRYTDYNLWANKRLTDKLNALKPGDWLIEQMSSFTTIKRTLLHIYDAETIWFKRLNGESPAAMPGRDFRGSCEEIIVMLLDISFQFFKFVKSSDEAFLSTVCNYKSTEGKAFASSVSDIIQHCMNHSTFHRGQLVTMMRFCGLTELPSTDYITYLREQDNK